MKNQIGLKADFLFEVSWEACNKIGGIYTVITSRSNIFKEALDDNYIFIGPDVWKETDNHPYFIEDKQLYKTWREIATEKGLKIRIGRFKQASNAVAILVDFTQYFTSKDQIFANLWEKYALDSITGGWDYVEPALFGYAAGKVIESFVENNTTIQDRIVAQFHEWLTGSGVLFLNQYVPQVATVFTTHATILGRSIAGHGWPLYGNLKSYNPDGVAKELGVMAKYSLEKSACKNADILTSVSEITRSEILQFAQKDIDYITPNGFDTSIVPVGEDYKKARTEARKSLNQVARAIHGVEFDDNVLHITNAGRSEFRNKGIDLFLASLKQFISEYDGDRKIIIWLMVPGNQSGVRKEAQRRLGIPDNTFSGSLLTHHLYEPEQDKILTTLNAIYTEGTSKVFPVYVPAFLDGRDGIFNKTYYDLLPGFDLTVFPSYYEPWGYTPHESLAFGIPTITTSLTGFGQWVNAAFGKNNPVVKVITRNEDNAQDVVNAIASELLNISGHSPEELMSKHDQCIQIAEKATWEALSSHYVEAYNAAIEIVESRSESFRWKKQQEPTSVATPVKKKNEPEWRKILINPSIPSTLEGISRLAKNLWWSWNQDALDLFESIDKDVWYKVKFNPMALIEELPLERWRELAADKSFMKKFKEVMAHFDKYMEAGNSRVGGQIAYFSMEYGLHDSVKIYSGGLGMLAGDYIKEASDNNKNFIAVGLLYRYGYFKQEISTFGDQVARYYPQKFSHLPVNPVRDSQDNWITISIALPGRNMYAKVWKLDVGRVPLYLLDTDIPENIEKDRSVTYQLYGGDWENRFKQELLLGVGGIRMIEALGYKPEIYHLNEGHAAFIGLERLKDLVQKTRLSLSQAVEVVRSTSLFTTHTPVPAGHDAFSEDLLRAYIPHYAERLHMSWNDFMNLGRFVEDDQTALFSMSALASKLSQEINGVSRIHGKVTRDMFVELYDGYYPEELHIGYVTNGVHYPTWTARSMQRLYQKYFPKGFEADSSNVKHWSHIADVPDQELLEARNKQKQQLIDYLKFRLSEEMTIRQDNPKLIVNTLEALDTDALTIGFARRFATYKRAHLLFTNPERLEKILNNPSKPVRFIFAGKAHPSDKAGQELIKKIVEISRQPKFIGKVIFVENYDIELAKYLIHGVDIWLNTPTRPLEASGTSGQKAVMNGVANFSVLDGWWAEGYTPGAGWALKEEQTYASHDLQNELDAELIYSILEEEIIPTFFYSNENGIPTKWLGHVRKTIAEIAPNFTTQRMLDDYYRLFYNKLFERGALMTRNSFASARELASWKRKVNRSWDKIEVEAVVLPEATQRPLEQGENFTAEIILSTDLLSSEDLGVELIFGRKDNDKVSKILFKQELTAESLGDHKVKYTCTVTISNAGVYDYSFRMFPKHQLLASRMDFPLVKWL